MSKERKGHKVCLDIAENTKETVEKAISALDKVPKNVVSILREGARADSKFHREQDKRFKYGHGPAVQER